MILKRLNKIPSYLTDLLKVEEDKEKFAEYYHEACTKAVRELITKLIDKRIEDSLKKTDDPVQLTNPAYPYLQSYQSGYRQAMADLKYILNH